jgi:hypothetical protein
MNMLGALGLAAAGTAAAVTGFKGKMKEMDDRKKEPKKKKEVMSEVSDSRLDQILSATGEKQDRADRKSGKLQ